MASIGQEIKGIKKVPHAACLAEGGGGGGGGGRGSKAIEAMPV